MRHLPPAEHQKMMHLPKQQQTLLASPLTTITQSPPSMCLHTCAFAQAANFTASDSGMSKIIASEDTCYETATGNDGSKILKFHIDVPLIEIDSSGINAYLSAPVRKQIVSILRTQQPEDGAVVILDTQTTGIVDACYLDKIHLYCISTITRKNF